MRVIMTLVWRNLLVFFRDRSAVFFSFLSVLIIIGLYALFLADTQAQSLKSLVGDISGIRFLVDSWIMAGLLAVNTVTVSLGALAVMVKDQDKKVLRDFMVAPLKRSNIVLSYILSSFIIGSVVSIVGLVVMEVYIYYSGGQLLAFEALLKVLALVLLCVLSSTALMFLITSYIRSISAFSTLSTIIGTMIGFLAGIYVPIGVMPQAVQNLIKVVPTAHAAAILRQIFMEEPLRIVFKSAPREALETYKEMFGVVFKLDGTEISAETMLLYLSALTAVFIILGIVRVRYMRAK